jgi:hypothetical protein
MSEKSLFFARRVDQSIKPSNVSKNQALKRLIAGVDE